MSKGDLTLIIPLRNHGRFVRKAVMSALEEEIPKLEILVVDDASTDGGAATVADLPVRVCTLHRHSGASASRNTGLRLATGEFIAFLDADDYLAPGGLRSRLDWLSARPEEGAVGGRLAGFVDGEGNLLPLPLPYSGNFRLTLQDLQQNGQCSIHFWVGLFRKTLIEKVGWFDERLTVVEDHDYLFRILHLVSLPMLDLPVVYYRWHGENSSGSLVDGCPTLSRRARSEWILVTESYGIPF